METNSVLTAKGVKKIYGQFDDQKVVALKGIDLNMVEGEFVCIMGPSGSGKSTLLNVLSTIDLPSKGFVHINGTNVVSMTEYELGQFRYKNLGFIFQEFHLIESLTILDNIAVPLSLANVNKEEIKARVEDIAKKLNIEMTLEKHPSECSGGQRQRVAIARALVTNPRLIVADEPTGNLDSQNSHELLSIFRRLNKEQGVTILMVTHDATIASYSTKMLRIKDGLIETELEADGMSQKEYFYKIVEANSQESQLEFMD
ncbi:ABC transporter ATP-binding protein [Beduini massiliensis]|uniref:ABC transporter ATP-binding protein n=1 Tax=Beduini massiliensis TaxID=1585974 RepID=UPI00059A99B4|nr:ABC transporter ATP-binding protein [Beduini massiliensis]